MKIGPFNGRWLPCKEPRRYVLIALHGRGGSAADFEGLEESWQVPGLSFIYLDGPDPFYAGRSWFDLPPHPLPGILRSRELLAQLFVFLDKSGFPPEHCFLLGFSQGALLTFEFGARYERQLAGYIGISGHVHDVNQLIAEARPDIARKGSWLRTHGLHDQQLSVEIARAQSLAMKKAGFNLDYREYDKGHTFDFKREMPEICQWVRKRCK